MLLFEISKLLEKLLSELKKNLNDLTPKFSGKNSEVSGIELFTNTSELTLKSYGI